MSFHYCQVITEEAFQGYHYLGSFILCTHIRGEYYAVPAQIHTGSPHFERALSCIVWSSISGRVQWYGGLLVAIRVNSMTKAQSHHTPCWDSLGCLSRYQHTYTRYQRDDSDTATVFSDGMTTWVMSNCLSCQIRHLICKEPEGHTPLTTDTTMTAPFGCAPRPSRSLETSTHCRWH